jgi:hypothetical protein
VPVAENRDKLLPAKDARGDFFRAVQKQRPRQYQGLYVVSPEGKVLSSHQEWKNYKNWRGEVLAMLQEGVRAFGDVTPRQVRRADSLPLRGCGVDKDGGATLAIYLRENGRGLREDGLGNLILDSVTLTDKELATLAPAEAEVDSAWVVPEAVARKFSGVCGPGDETSMPRPKEVTAARVSGRVKRVADGVAYLTFSGRIAAAHKQDSGKFVRGDTSLTGVGAYDVRGKRLLSLTWVFDGLYCGPPPHDQPARYGAVVEWRRQRAEP